MADRSIFPALDGAARNALMTAGREAFFSKGSEIFSESTRCDDIYLLLSGFVSLYRDSFRGDTRAIFICAEGELLNEVALMDGKSAASACALADCTVLALERETLAALLSQFPGLGQALFASLARKTARLYHKVGNDNGTYALYNRMAATLWKLTRDYGREAEGARQLGFELSVNFLAMYMGAKRESVSRALSAMRKQGLISHEGGCLRVPDMDKLKKAISE